MGVGRGPIFVGLDRRRRRVSFRALDTVLIVVDHVCLGVCVAGAELVLVCSRRAAADLFLLAGLVDGVLLLGIRVSGLERVGFLVPVRRLTLRSFQIIEAIGSVRHLLLRVGRRNLT